MPGHVQVDTGLMQGTAQQSANRAENMIIHAKTLSTGIDFVVQRWQGLAGDAFRNAMVSQKTTLNQLIQKLQFVAETINRGGQGLDSQDQSGRTKLQAHGQFLNGKLNG